MGTKSLLAIVSILSIFGLSHWQWNPMSAIRWNNAAERAQKYFEEGNYKETEAALYELRELDSLSESRTIDHAHTYFKNEDTLSVVLYQQVSQSTDSLIRSFALNQLGIHQVMKSQRYEGNPKQADAGMNLLKESLQFFADALRSHPFNSPARYNYELVSRILAEKQKQKEENKDKNQDQENKDQNQDQENQENQDSQDKNQDSKDGDSKENGKEEQDKDKKSEEKNGDSKESKDQKEAQEQKGAESKEGKKEEEQRKQMEERLKEMNLSPEKAKMLFEAMKNREIQHLQQLRRMPTTPIEDDKPDW